MVVRVARLPGIRFEVQPPPPVQVLPRMDIAVFVGFAASGPLNVPVAIEDAAHFRSIFGEDLPLVWDEQRGVMEIAYLAPAVRAFFRTGGKRCYAIRVAGKEAETNRFPIPGLLCQGSDGRLDQAYAQARSAGSWSDRLQVGYELLSQPIRLVSAIEVEPSGGSYQATLGLARPGGLQAGDMLRLNLEVGGERYQCLFIPETITESSTIGSAATSGRYRYLSIPETIADGSTSGGETNCRVTWMDGRWFRLPGLPALGSPPSGSKGEAQFYDGTTLQGSPPTPIEAWVVGDESWQPERPLALGLDLPPEQSPMPGTLVRTNFGDQRLWLTVYRTSERGGKLSVIGAGLWESDEPDSWVTAGRVSHVERLRMCLKARMAGGPAGDLMAISGLGLAPGHASYWAGLPTDAQLYAVASPGEANPYLKLWQTAAEPRFPLAGIDPAVDTYLPLVDPAGEVLFAGATPSSSTALERNGLASFSLELFLDPLLKDENHETLMATADYLTYQCPKPHLPAGIHAALRLDEATLIAVPDALHLGWRRENELGPEPETVPATPPDLKCTPPLAADTTGLFSDWNLLETPSFSTESPLEPGGTSHVNWTRVELPDAASLLEDPAWRSLAGSPPPVPELAYRLEEACLEDFSDAVAVYTGGEPSYDLSVHGAGKYYYRVRAEILADGRPVIVSNWSDGLRVRIGMTNPWKAITATELDHQQRREYESDLASFYSALLELCTARGDLLAVLGLPAYFHEDEALRFAGGLREGFGEIAPRVLSFGALYHPWLHLHEKEQKEQVVLTPPEGAVCGAIARRTLARGAWLASAGEPLQDTVGLQPYLAESRYLELQEGAVNLVRREPRGFMSMSEGTLSREEELHPIHVRRLLMLLRRLVLRQGALYLFEPNSPAFRRQVQSGFEEILADLFARGAFRGSTPAEAYQVDVSDRLNPPASVEQGRLIVEIRVAPSQALLFLTVRLVMTGSRSIQFQEGKF